MITSGFFCVTSVVFFLFICILLNKLCEPEPVVRPSIIVTGSLRLLLLVQLHAFEKSLGNWQEWQSLPLDTVVSISKILNHGKVEDLLGGTGFALRIRNIVDLLVAFLVSVCFRNRASVSLHQNSDLPVRKISLLNGKVVSEKPQKLLHCA